MLAAGLLLADGVLLVLGLATLAWVGLSLLFASLNPRALEVRIEGPRVVRAGDEFRLKVTVANPRRWLDAIGLRLAIDGPGGILKEADVDWVVAGGESTGEVRLSANGRGDAETLHCRISSNFPWGLWQVVTRKGVGFSLTVLPLPIVPVELLEGGSDQEMEGRFDPRRREQIGVPRGLREYRAGDRPQEVAWAASVRAMARGTGLIVREWEPPGLRPRKVTVLFHSHGGDGELIRPDRFERAISLAWGALGQLEADGVELEWLADFDAWVPVSVGNRKDLGRLGDRLAACRREASTERHELEARLNECRGEVWVVSDMRPSSWLGAIHLPPNVRVIDVARFEKGRRLKMEGGSRA